MSSIRRKALARDPATQAALAVIAASTALHLILATLIGFGVDESYVLSISRDLDLSYFDHPPLHLWIAHFSQSLFGAGHTVRLPFVLLSAVSSWLMFALSRRLFGPRAGLWSLLAFNLSAFFAVAAGGWVLPDGPLNACLLAATLAATRLIDTCAAPGRWNVWIALGFWIGLGALAKYQAIIFGVGLLGFLATSQRYRRHFGELAPYSGLAVALALFVPVLVWNAQNGWASFLFQGGRGLPQNSPDAGRMFAQIVGEVLLILPWIFFPLVVATVRAVRLSHEDDRYRLCLWLGLPNILLLTLSPLWGAKGMPHWPMPGWLLLFPLLGAWFADFSGRTSWPRRWLAGSSVLAVLLVFLATTDSATGWAGARFPQLFAHGDPTIESLEWIQLHSRLTERGFLERRHLFVITTDWKVAGKIDQVLAGALPVHIFGPKQHGYAYRPNSGGIVGDDALLIDKSAVVKDSLTRLRSFFRSVGPPSFLDIGRGGRPELTLGIVYARGLLRAYPRTN